MKEYIGSQQHWEDSINDDYDKRERMQQEQVDTREPQQPYNELNEIFSDEDDEGVEEAVRDLTGCLVLVGAIILGLIGWGIYEIIN